MPQIRITEKVKSKLDELKEEWGSQTYNEVINLLIEKRRNKKYIKNNRDY